MVTSPWPFWTAAARPRVIWAWKSSARDAPGCAGVAERMRKAPSGTRGPCAAPAATGAGPVRAVPASRGDVGATKRAAVTAAAETVGDADATALTAGVADGAARDG